MCLAEVPIHINQWFSSRADFYPPLQETHLAIEEMSGEIFDCHNWRQGSDGVDSYYQLVGRGLLQHATIHEKLLRFHSKEVFSTKCQ